MFVLSHYWEERNDIFYTTENQAGLNQAASDQSLSKPSCRCDNVIGYVLVWYNENSFQEPYVEICYY